MLGVVIFFLLVALWLYVLLGGADFGAGIVELFTPRARRRETENIVYRAIGPVWEANHMWLIIVVVILFVAFPAAYADISTYLHWPMLLMLIGIIARGSTFAFRHYDAIQDGAHVHYSRLFRWSSFLTPLFLGVIVGALILGRFPRTVTTFAEGFLWPWLHVFPLTVGLFFSAISALLAATFLVGEVDSADDRSVFIRAALRWNAATVVLGGLVLLLGWWYAPHVFGQFFQSPFSLGLLVFATLMLVLLAAALGQGKVQIARLWVGAEVSAILGAWLVHQYPVIYYTEGGRVAHTLGQLAAPPSTLQALGIALIVGAIVFLPALGYLVWAFKYRQTPSA